MNQVTEMLRLSPGAPVEDAVARLASLFEMMSEQPGFRDAEVLRNLAEPDLILVLHAWDSLEAWQAFQTSEAKIAFSAGRPASLYTFVPCGMNWRLETGDRRLEAAFLRREVLREPVTPGGTKRVSVATFAYQDAEPALAGTSMRLTRYEAAPSSAEAVPAEELYESLLVKQARAEDAARTAR